MDEIKIEKKSFIDKIKSIKKKQIIGGLIIAAIVCAAIVFVVLMLNGTIGVVPKGE